MDDLQKLIVTFFILTIIFSIMSLLMFFVEVPYKSTMHCKDNLTDTDGNNLNSMSLRNNNSNMQHQDCTWTASKEPSAVFDAIINVSMICGSIFVLLSAYAFYKKRKETKNIPQ